MITWKSVSDEQALATWDAMLAGLGDYSPFQSYAWGEYRRGLGWKPYRLVAVDDQDRVVAMIQAYLRKYALGIGLVWAEGGPNGDLSAFGEKFQQCVRSETGLSRCYFRFRCDRRRKIEDVLQLSALGWSLPWSPMVSNYSMIVDLTQTEEQLTARCERNWRRNLKRSQETGLTITTWLNASADAVHSIYASMEAVKGLEEQHSRAEIAELIKQLGSQLILLRCDDNQGQLLSLMGCIVLGDNAVSVLSATSERGRELHSSYATFRTMLQHCRAFGVKTYDLAGIDPVRNPGVYRFKRASGAEPVELLGEWDWATHPWLRWLGNWAIARRGRMRSAEAMINVADIDQAQPQAKVAALRAQVQFGES